MLWDMFIYYFGYKKCAILSSIYLLNENTFKILKSSCEIWFYTIISVWELRHYQNITKANYRINILTKLYF